MKDLSIFEQPYEVVKKWFEDRNKVPLNEIKVVFLGDGEAGKSHTIARLMNDGGDPIDYTDQSTPGIVIKNKDYDLDGRKFQNAETQTQRCGI
jgi:GTPase SAR1 family protein